MTSAIWAIGARSPQAPTEPLELMTGVTPLLSSATRVCVISGRLPELPWAWTLIARRHGGAHDLDRRGLADAGGVVVDEEALELLHLVVVEHDLAELADTGVGAVHDLARRDLLLDHRAADLDALEGRRVELHLLTLPGDEHELLDGERRAVQDDGHGCVSSRGAQAPRLAARRAAGGAATDSRATVGEARRDAQTCRGLSGITDANEREPASPSRPDIAAAASRDEAPSTRAAAGRSRAPRPRPSVERAPRRTPRCASSAP